MAARTGIGGEDQLKRRGIGRHAASAVERHLPRLEHLPKRLENLGRELRRFVAG